MGAPQNANGVTFNKSIYTLSELSILNEIYRNSFNLTVIDSLGNAAQAQTMFTQTPSGLLLPVPADGNGHPYGISIRNASDVYVLASTVETANSNSGNLTVGQFTELAVDVNVSAVSGTSPTLNLYVDRLGADGIWYTIYTAAQVTAVATVSTTIGNGAVTASGFGNTVRLRWVLGGTTPSFTFSASIIGK